MGNKMEITVKISNNYGEIVTTKTSERNIPYIEEIEEQGFRSAFHEIETAVLEVRKEVSDEAVSEYLETMSKKKR